MIKVVGVKFKSANKIYYFDPDGFDYVKLGDHVIVETARGMEYGTVALDITEVPEKEIVQPLKKLVRIANKEDDIQHQENLKKRQKAMDICEEKIAKHGLEMKLVDVEYTFDKTKVIFYFTADGRVDFRELVKDLASVFKMRIELRQIGVRDEAKFMGGIGNCGKGLCCHTWLPEFQPVSIKMAKTQNLSLNPTKISGICGRLMCCLKFENEVYTELSKGMPDVGEKIKTPDGIAIVQDVNILLNKVKVRLIESAKNDPEMILSTEFFTYGKEEIKRLSKKKPKKREEEEVSDELKELLKD